MAQQGRTPKPKKSDAYIADIDGKLLVRPSAAVVGKHKKFQISNLTDFAATVVLPAGLAVDNNPGKTITIPPHDYGEFDIGNNPEGAQSYSVQVTIGGVARPAHGDSDPVIIIDPECP